MAKLSIEGIYTLSGDHLVRQTDRQLLHIQPNICKPKQGAKRHPKDLLILIQPNGRRVRLSGLFEVTATSGSIEWSCDIEGINYRLKLLSDHTAVIQQRTKKAKAGQEKAQPAADWRTVKSPPELSDSLNVTAQLRLW